MELGNEADGSVGRGPEAVRQRLITAAVELLSERSPALITNKEIAAKAGVNHGQIHHYFASKDDLIAKAITREANVFVEERLVGLDELPAPIDARRRYSIWRALAYLAVHSESLDIASPVIAHLVETEAARRGTDTSDDELLADVAVLMSMRYGWSVFQDHIMRSFDAYGPDEEAVRDAVDERAKRVMDKLI